MKRRRGRKGKSKKPRVAGATDVASNAEQNSGADELENDEADSGAEAEAETPSSAEPSSVVAPSSAEPSSVVTQSSAEPSSAAPSLVAPSSAGTVQPERPVTVSSVRPLDSTAGRIVYSRVKVKLKNSKALDSQPISSSQPTTEPVKLVNSKASDSQPISQPTSSEPIKVMNSKALDSQPASSQPTSCEPVKVMNSKALDSQPASSQPTSEPVKLTNSKGLDSQPTSSEPRTQSDTDKSSLQVLEKQGVSEKMDDSANSLSENNLSVPEIPLKKFGGIRIKSSKGLTSATISPCSNTELVKGEKKNEKEPDDKISQYKKQELDVSLEVTKKVMKMDAAEPFNAPVNPVALGIPDYFDVIDTPMDFGTICTNLENGVKYMNAADVLKDVQYIWDNCYKYNNKGDYIVELMKRAKKNFTKCWVSAGLYSPDQAPGAESNQVKDVTTPENGPDNGGSASQSTKKRHTLKKHKDGCLCAICVMIRRRQEREEIARMIEGQTEVSDDYMDEEAKPQGISPLQSPGGDYNSSNMDYSPEVYTNSDHGERGGKEIKWEDGGNQHTSLSEKHQESDGVMLSQRRGEDETSEHSQRSHRPGEESRGEVDEMDANKPQRPKVVLDERQKARMYENLRYLENPLLLELCGTLFGDGNKSAWNGTHSLVRQQHPRRRSSIHAAIATFMK